MKAFFFIIISTFIICPLSAQDTDSLEDMLINKKHSIRLMKAVKNNKKDIILLNGTHNEPEYNMKFKNKLVSLSYDFAY
jgi:hypothetical protein